MHLNASFFAVLLLVGLIFIVGNKAKVKSPRYRARLLLTENETEFFHRLRRALPDAHVFPQVAMSALIEPCSRTKERIGDFNRISQKRVDFAICDPELKLMAVVELDDRTHNRNRDAARDAALASAAIRTIRFESTRKPTEAEIRLAVFAHQDTQVDPRKPRPLTLVS
ncbi:MULTISPECIES: DUF2726 domain-containing protein [Caballeronia]|uniref:DUF2726 domain-containing protein n=1 Tax=Caballeronia zhejiangensis TaxID=871203 RepID=A0A656QHE2_9BURK|nr:MULTISPECIES: DUF2726 domain-containing protein [Caballeronia]KDR28495.1 hypothetical protein BG60_11275 [Caballeronia zhejiangensis]